VLLKLFIWNIIITFHVEREFILTIMKYSNNSYTWINEEEVLKSFGPENSGKQILMECF